MQRTDWWVMSDREHGRWEGIAGGIVVGVVLTLWIIYGGV